MAVVEADHNTLGLSARCCVPAARSCCFTENNTNEKRLYGAANNPSPYVKDGFHEHVVNKIEGAVNPDQVGTKACALLFTSRSRPGSRRP